ncbi:hypothetical protein T439DRAFT_358883 [Meredithblackwellia eburnea MCA 4105]
MSKAMSDPVTAIKQDREHVEHRQGYAGRIENPLLGIPREQLLKEVEAFANEKGLVDRLPMLRKGAILAQSPHAYDELDILDADEKAVIAREHSRKWDQSGMLIFAVLLCSLGACVQGWDQTGSNGANLSFPQYFGIYRPKDHPDHMKGEWLIGLINSAPYISSAFLGCWLSDPLNNYFGRRGCIFITAIILIITPIGSGLCHTWEQLFICRLLMGVGMGAKGATVPLFAAENSPAAIRGGLTMGWQLWTAFGIFLGFCANAVVASAGAIAWRLQLGSAFLPALPLAIGVYFCPESPRWLMKKNRYPEAYHSLLRFRKHELQAARDLYYIHVQLALELDIKKGATYVGRFVELFTIPRVRRATLASFVRLTIPCWASAIVIPIVMIGQQMCGINIIAFYSSSVFKESGYSDMEALYASIGFGAINFVCAFPAIITIDTFGRRSLLLATFPQMAWTLLAAGFAFYIEDVKIKLGVVALFIYLFAAFYSVGEGPVPFAYSAEVFPLAQREQGMAWAVATCLFWAAVLGLTWPAMLAALTPTGAFGFYAGLNVCAFVLIFFFLPETKQRTLEELDQVFSVPTSRFASYQVNTFLPYVVKRHVLRNKRATLAPLFVTDGTSDYDTIMRTKSRVSEKNVRDMA